MSDLNTVWETLEPKPLILERFVVFEREISVVVARGLDGNAVAFDPVENRHHDGILSQTHAPARIPLDVGPACDRDRAEGCGGAQPGGVAGGRNVCDCGGCRAGE